jgi:hypothetical protein
MPAHAIFLIGYDLESELFPCRAEEDVPHSIIASDGGQTKSNPDKRRGTDEK